MEENGRALYLDPSKPIDKRVNDLISRLTLDEKISQMTHDAKAVDRLGIPAYNWWNECLHGLARTGLATVFPQTIGMAATWNTPLIHKLAVVTSDEARAKFNAGGNIGVYGQALGLTFWAPNINIFRDPRWGRGQETYGEDPYLTGRMGVSFCKGLQGDDPKYLKLVATPKHYAVHSGPENDRHRFDAQVSQRDLRETYLPAFKAAVQEAKAYSVMGAYNRTNGEACNASPTLLQHILREEWGFEGYVVSDCGAIDDIYRDHKVVKTPEEAAALAVKEGCDLNCGGTYLALVKAVKEGLISEAEINKALRRLFTARFLLGMFDPVELVPFSRIPPEKLDCAEHAHLALEVARESIVMLKNKDIILPLAKGKLKSIAVIGPKADDALVLAGNYYGTPSAPVTILQGIQQRVPDKVKVRFATGCDLASDSTDGFAEAIKIAKQSQAAVVVLGLSQLFEGEEGQEEGNPKGQRSFGDRTQIDLPGVQEDLLKTVVETGTPVILVLLNGSALAINWAQENVPAILEAWYPGQAGGLAVADVILGNYNPAGRLPVTFYQSVTDLPPFDDYNMADRTYRFFKGQALYPFGYGLSYTSFEYSDLRIRETLVSVDETVKVVVNVKNTGGCAGDEVVQLYLQDVETSVPVPICSLQGFVRVHLAAGEAQDIEFILKPEQLVCYADDGTPMVEPGEFKVWVGGCSPVFSGAVVKTPELVNGSFKVAKELRQKPNTLEVTVPQTYRLPFLLHLPKDYSTSQKYPLILFLHGAGERGDGDFTLLRRHGIPKIVEECTDFPFITLSPQCPDNSWWADQIPALDVLLKQVCKDYLVDEDRIYVTGMSMGGYGTWSLSITYPQRFAAIAPICGGGPWFQGFPERCVEIKHLPIWVFHGAKDPVVPLIESEVMVNTLKAAGGLVRFTVYPEADHDSWTETFNNPELYKWFLSHKRRG